MKVMEQIVVLFPLYILYLHFFSSQILYLFLHICIPFSTSSIQGGGFPVC